jgi:hypothetical protein
MRATAVLLLVAAACPGAELESRVLTHYVPQDLLEKAVRTEGWTEVPLNVKGGLRKGYTIRIWAGGLIDRGNGEQPGENTAGPDGPHPHEPVDAKALALSPRPEYAFALLFKTRDRGPVKAPPRGKPLEIAVTRDGEQLWVGFNDARGRYRDNHLGRGRRNELEPLWVRVEVVHTIVD